MSENVSKKIKKCLFFKGSIKRQQDPESPDIQEKVQNVFIKDSKHFKKVKSEQEVKTEGFLVAADTKNQDEFTLPHPIWSEREVDSVQITHRKPITISDKLAYFCVMVLRKSFDIVSGYTVGKYMKTIDERDVLHRVIFLETVAGIFGFFEKFSGKDGDTELYIGTLN